MEQVGVAFAGGDPVGDADLVEARDLAGGEVDQALHGRDRVVGRRFGQDDGELVAAEAEALIGGAGGADRVGDGAEDLVPGGVAEGGR